MADTNPTAREEMQSALAHSRFLQDPEGLASVAINELVDAYRSEVLAEAVEAARSEYLTDTTGTDEDNAYNNGITDAVAAIGALTEGGAR